MLAALDLNADRILAVSGNVTDAGQGVSLVASRQDLPLALSLEKRQVSVGHAGLAICRRSPQYACVGFLPHLGRATTWKHGRKFLNAEQALTHVLTSVKHKLGTITGVGLALPGYLSRDQVAKLMALAKKAGLPITGVATRTLASALHSHAEHPWHNVAVLVDVDDYALTIAVLRAGDTEMKALGQKVYSDLGLKAWRDRLLACIANLCVQSSRRDPRASPEADQMVFDQLDDVLDASSQGRPATLRVNGIEWFQTVAIQPSEASAACAALAQRTAVAIEAALRWAEQQLTTASIYFTAPTARLPGLAGAVYARCENRVSVSILPAHAAALATFDLAQRIERRELSPGLFEPAAPLPVAESGDVPDMIPFPARRQRAAPERP